MRSKALLLKRGHELSPMDRMNLEVLLLSEPDMATAYYLKEEFCNIYNLVGKAKASTALEKWRSSVPKHMRDHFRSLLSATDNWRPEILAYFDQPQASAFNGALNGVSNAVRKAGSRRRFDGSRARALFGKQQ